MGRCMDQAEVGITLNRSATGTLALLGSASSLLQTELPQMIPDTVLALGIFKGFTHLPFCDAHNNLTFNKQCQRHHRKTKVHKQNTTQCLHSSFLPLRHLSPTAPALNVP